MSDQNTPLGRGRARGLGRGVYQHPPANPSVVRKIAFPHYTLAKIFYGSLSCPICRPQMSWFISSKFGRKINRFFVVCVQLINRFSHIASHTAMPCVRQRQHPAVATLVCRPSYSPTRQCRWCPAKVAAVAAYRSKCCIRVPAARIRPSTSCTQVGLKKMHLHLVSPLCTSRNLR